MTPPAPIDAPTTIVPPLPQWELDFLVRRTQSLLAAQVPLSLLLDLADPAGPDSSAFYVAERCDTTWLDARVG